MKKFTFFLLLAVAITCNGCNTQKQYKPATDALDAAREFVGACLKGDFEKANFYMLQDENNKQLLQVATSTFRNKSAAQQIVFKEASLQNITIENIDTLQTIIYYKYSFDNVARKVKSIYSNKIWLVDFKYSFNPNL